MKALKLLEPKPSTAFRNKYLAAIMTVAALLISSFVTAQLDSAKYSPINGYGFKYKRMVFDSILMIPRSTSPHVPWRAGAIRYNAPDSTLQLWTGNQWNSILTGIGNGVDTAYMINDTLLVIETPDQDYLLTIPGRPHIDSIYRKSGQDSIYYVKAGIEYSIKDSVGSSTTLSNQGSGFRLVKTANGQIKTIFFGYGITGDSTTNTNGITIKADTTGSNPLVTTSDLNDAISDIPTDEFVLGRNLESVDDTLKTKDTLISATPDLSENSDKVATTKWVTDKGYGTGSANAAGSTNDIQFKGSDGKLSAMPGNDFAYDSTNKILLIGNPLAPSAGEAIEIDTGNIDIKVGGYKIGDGYMLRTVGNETYLNENTGQTKYKVFTTGVARLTIENTLTTLSNTLSVANTIQVGGVDVIKDLGSELQIGAGAFWRKTFFVSNGTTVGMIDTARWGFANTSPTATVHISARSQGQYGAGLKVDSFPLLTNAEAYAVENDGNNLYWTDRNSSRNMIGRVLKGSTTWQPGVVSAGSNAITTLTVTGAVSTDVVHVNKVTGGVSNGEIYDAWVSAPNTITIRVHNVSTGSANYNTTETYNVVVLKY